MKPRHAAAAKETGSPPGPLVAEERQQPCGPHDHPDLVLDEPCSPAHDRPCQGTANVVLGVLKAILEERAAAEFGHLHIDEIRQVIDQFMQAPGRLESFYDDTYDRCHPAPTHGSSGRSPGASFDESVRALGGQETGSLTLGRFQMIGLRAVRERLGEDWDDAVERVQSLAEGVLRRRLSAQDSFTRSADGDFIVCFGALSDEEAWFKAKLIEQEIRERLLGSESDSALDDLELDLVTLSEVAEIASEVHAVPTPIDGLGASDDVCNAVVRRLEEAGRSLRHEIHEQIAALEDCWRVEARATRLATGTPARFAIAGVDWKTRRGLDRLMPVLRDQPSELVKIDLLAISAAAVFISHDREHRDSLLAVSVQASTLRDRAAFEAFSSACGGMAQALRNRLILVLDGLPRDLSPSVLTECLQRLRGYSRLQGLRLQSPNLDDLQLTATRAHLVLVDFAPVAAWLRREPRQFRKLLMGLHRVGARLLVDDVPSAAAAERLHEAGIDLWCPRPPEPDQEGA